MSNLQSKFNETLLDRLIPASLPEMLEKVRQVLEHRKRDGTVNREGAAIGVLISLEQPSAPMQTETFSADYYHWPGWNRDYPRVQILTINDLLRGKKIDMPPEHGTFKEASSWKSVTLIFESFYRITCSEMRNQKQVH